LTEAAVQTVSEVSEITAQGPCGRPLVKIRVGGVAVTAFIDTGSEVTLLKMGASQSMTPKRIYHEGRGLRGVSGRLFEATSEWDVDVSFGNGRRIRKCCHRLCLVEGIDFPGDVLIGMDFLQRFCYQLVHNHTPQRDYLKLQGIILPITYAVGTTLGITAVAEFTPQNHCQKLALRRTTLCPPRSGRYVLVTVPQTFNDKEVILEAATDKVVVPRTVVVPENGTASVWVVNGGARPVHLRNGTHVATGALCTVVDMKHSSERSRSAEEQVNDNSNVPEHLPEEFKINGDASDPDFRFEEDDFDVAYGQLDFGYDESDFVVFPETSLDDPPDIASVAMATDTQETGPDLSHLPDTQREDILALLANYPRLFSSDKFSIGTVPGVQHRIPTHETQPLCTRQWRLPEAAKQQIREECDAMLEAGVIEPSTSPWLSPVVLVKKKDGTVRFCVDYRRLNSVTIADTYPLPRIDELVDELRETAVFSLLDSRSAYWSIPVAPEDRPKTAFSDGYRLFQWRRMPFGLSTAPTTFQRTMNAILSPVLGRHTLAYLDDIVVYSKSFDEHLCHLKETLDILDCSGFKLNVNKCEFVVQNFRFLGFRVTPEGILPDPDKVRAIAEMPAPKTVRGVRRFLGATGFFRRHVPDYAKVAAPLTQLIKKDHRFRWTDECQKAFQSLKDALMNAPILRKPNFDLPFEIHTDASQVAIGAALMQRDSENKPHAIAYYSRKLRGPETRYSATDAEALAVVESVRTFDPYVYGRRFTVYTDHRPLVYVFTKKTKSPRMSRWAYELSGYSFNILYKPGTSHHIPDMLSRNISAVSIADPDPKTMRSEQLKDPMWHEIIAYLEEKAVPNRKPPRPLEEFDLQNGVLYHVRTLPDRIVSQLVVPRQLRRSALKLAHSSPIAAHPGVFRTFVKLKDMFYFPNMLRDVKEYVAACEDCQRRKGSPRKAPLAKPPDVSVPLEKVSADLIELGRSEAGYRYCLTIIDHLTRYVQIVPLKTKHADSVADAMFQEFVTIFGPPRLIQTDGGSEFNNRLFKECCRLLQIKTTLTTAYHPQANGMIERTNRVVKDAIASLANTTPTRWEQLIPQVRLALNSAIHRCTGDQPLYLMTGHHGHFPVGLTNDLVYNSESSKAFYNALNIARKVALETTRTAREQWTRDYDKRSANPKALGEGDLVLYKNRVRKTGVDKLQNPRWSGPARITKKIGPVTFLLKDLYHPFNERQYHINDIKPFKVLGEITYPDLYDEYGPEYVDPLLDDDAEPGVMLLASCI